MALRATTRAVRLHAKGEAETLQKRSGNQGTANGRVLEKLTQQKRPRVELRRADFTRSVEKYHKETAKRRCVLITIRVYLSALFSPRGKEIRSRKVHQDIQRNAVDDFTKENRGLWVNRWRAESEWA